MHNATSAVCVRDLLFNLTHSLSGQRSANHLATSYTIVGLPINYKCMGMSRIRIRVRIRNVRVYWDPLNDPFVNQI